jgi:hypothetical protein
MILCRGLPVGATLPSVSANAADASAQSKTVEKTSGSTAMPNPNLTTIEERLEGVAADALEKIIDEVEQKNRVHVTDLTVELIPDQGMPAGAPTVEVNVTVEPSKPTLTQV